MSKPLNALLKQLNTIILGKERQIRLALTCLFCRGHLLIEDVPGMGKTTLAHALAQVLGLSYNRVQFTNDLLPSDVLGVNIFNRETQTFTFHPGPVFANLVLADEINRASPKSQSALLEAMEERQVTIEGETHPLPEPFFVIATQNPQDQEGTQALPESQLDRFFMRIHLGYPPEDAERALLMGHNRRDAIRKLTPLLKPEHIIALQHQITRLTVTQPLVDYVLRLLNFTRTDDSIPHGLSPRAGLNLLHAARGWAFLNGRTHVLPEDVQAVFPAVAEHRLGGHSPLGSSPLSEYILASVNVL
ncbi:MoxR family ATPase [Hahella sp. SMD15-11]|uniref:MoxR family ATPase n=1 Tax=Thermohahella caldifontis TaxID=3142973 RepID=A0AB39UX11_9GAMM